MGSFKQFLVFVCLVFAVEFAHSSTEFVPVYMLSNKRTTEKVPALHKISEDTFRDDILERMADHPLTVIFAEQTLSPEDFAQHDQKGILFPNIAKLGESFKVAYLPYVQNPIEAIRHLDVTVKEVQVDSLQENLEIPETDVLIINLNDVKDSETRIDMLRRHDAAIDTIYRELIRTNRNVLALYTARHTSWVAPEDVVSSRHTRSLLAADDAAVPKEAEVSNFYNNSNLYLYVDYSQVTLGQDKNATNVTFTYKIEKSGNETILLTLSDSTVKPQIDLVLNFTNGASAGYWELLDPVKLTIKNDSNIMELNITSSAPMYAPNGFSYHCGDQVFTDGNFTVFMKDFQLQVFFEEDVNGTYKFGDAYDCVGFTSVPIWSGLFVTVILLLIMTIGVTMMMDIRTMDRFDDAKGKTITIIEN